MTHHYTHYDRISAPSLTECADSSPLSEQREFIINLPRCLEFDFNQQISAQLSWEAARVTCQIPLHTLFVPLYSLWQLSNQYCTRSKKVLRTADILVASLGVTSSWGSTYHAADDARRVDTVQGCDYYSTYDTMSCLHTQNGGYLTQTSTDFPALISRWISRDQESCSKSKRCVFTFRS